MIRARTLPAILLFSLFSLNINILIIFSHGGEGEGEQERAEEGEGGVLLQIAKSHNALRTQLFVELSAGIDQKHPCTQLGICILVRANGCCKQLHKQLHSVLWL